MLSENQILRATEVLANAQNALSLSDFKMIFPDMAEHYWIAFEGRDRNLVKLLRYLDPHEREQLVGFVCRFYG